MPEQEFELRVFDTPYEDVEEKLSILRFLGKDWEYLWWGPDGNNPSGVGYWKKYWEEKWRSPNCVEELQDCYTPTSTCFGLYKNGKLVAVSRAIIHPEHPIQKEKLARANRTHAQEPPAPLEALCYSGFKAAAADPNNNALITGISDETSCRNYIELNRCAIHPEYQGKGLLYLLMAKMLDALKDYDGHLFTTTSFDSVATVLQKEDLFKKGPSFKYDPSDQNEKNCTLFVLPQDEIPRAIECYQENYAKNQKENEVKRKEAAIKAAAKENLKHLKLQSKLATRNHGSANAAGLSQQSFLPAPRNNRDEDSTVPSSTVIYSSQNG